MLVTLKCTCAVWRHYLLLHNFGKYADCPNVSPLKVDLLYIPHKYYSPSSF